MTVLFQDDSSKRTSNTSNETSSTSQLTSHAIHQRSKSKYGIVQFTSTSPPVDEDLAKSFLTDSQIPPMKHVIREEKDIYNIDAKVIKRSLYVTIY